MRCPVREQPNATRCHWFRSASFLYEVGQLHHAARDDKSEHCCPAGLEQGQTRCPDRISHRTIRMTPTIQRLFRQSRSFRHRSFPGWSCDGIRHYPAAHSPTGSSRRSTFASKGARLPIANSPEPANDRDYSHLPSGFRHPSISSVSRKPISSLRRSIRSILYSSFCLLRLSNVGSFQADRVPNGCMFWHVPAISVRSNNVRPLFKYCT